MLTCCDGKQVSNKDELREYISQLTRCNTRLRYFRQYIVRWLQSSWPIFYNRATLAFHGDVGNAEILLNKGSEVKIIISGFCVAGEAGFAYVRDILDSPQYEAAGQINVPIIKAKHSFGTENMRNGTIDLIAEHGINREIGDNLTPEETFEKARRGELPLLLTQALCPIVASYSSRSPGVWEALKNDEMLRNFISRSLTKWWKTIELCHSKNKDLTLILMGRRERGRAELQKTLAYSRLDNDNNVIITDREQGENSLLFKLENMFRDRLIFTRHAAARNYNN
ncbi:MAG TPA: hypothetical protein GXX38_10525 [Clostridia bacterium]|nr:hypothetical protein [Clostridia bacterium]